MLGLLTSVYIMYFAMILMVRIASGVSRPYEVVVRSPQSTWQLRSIFLVIKLKLRNKYIYAWQIQYRKFSVQHKCPFDVHNFISPPLTTIIPLALILINILLNDVKRLLRLSVHVGGSYSLSIKTKGMLCIMGVRNRKGN